MSQQVLASDQAFDCLQANGKSFSFASWFLNPRMAERAALLYTFCRLVDDAVDETDDEVAARQALAQLRLQSRQLPLAMGVSLPTHAVDALFHGVNKDLSAPIVTTQAELLDYCYCVAGSVGELMATVLECQDPSAKSHAVALGIAMQLTNIARDVTADAALGRRYLPREWLNADIEPEDLVANQADIVPAVQRCLLLAEQYYRFAERGMQYIPLRSRLGIYIAGNLYRQIGLDIMVDPSRVFRQRVVVSYSRKIAIGIVSGWRFLHSRGLHRLHAESAHATVAHAEILAEIKAIIHRVQAGLVLEPSIP